MMESLPDLRIVHVDCLGRGLMVLRVYQYCPYSKEEYVPGDRTSR